MSAVLPRRRVFLTRTIVLAAFTFALSICFCGVPLSIAESALGRELFGITSSVCQRSGRTSSFERLDMTTAECRAAFPGLTREVEIAVARGPFDLKRMPSHATGMVQGRIEDGKVGSEGLLLILSGSGIFACMHALCAELGI